MGGVELTRQVANDVENFLIRIEQVSDDDRDELFNRPGFHYFDDRRIYELRRIISNAISAYDAQTRGEPPCPPLTRSRTSASARS